MESNVLFVILPSICLVGIALFGAAIVVVATSGRFGVGPFQIVRQSDRPLNIFLTGAVGFAMITFALVTPITMVFLTLTGLFSLDPATPEAATQPDLPTPTESIVVELTDPPIATNTPAPTATSTPPPVTTGEVSAGRVQLREGPSYVYAVLGVENSGAELPVYGITPDLRWAFVRRDNADAWVRTTEVNFNTALTQIPFVDQIPPTPEPSSIPVITAIDPPQTVGPDGAGGQLSWIDVEQDVQFLRFESVVGTFNSFEVTVQGSINSLTFELFECGEQTVTLSVQVEDEA
ncbi:MAG: hypothetical protein GYB68_05320, partial [Chloroflexi bacterium]|nr:hypothetical protein [Chloroflexota bacterium]